MAGLKAESTRLGIEKNRYTRMPLAVSIWQMKRRFALGGILALIALVVIVLLSRQGGRKPNPSAQVLVITQDSRVVLLPRQQHYTVVAHWRTSTSNPPPLSPARVNK